MSESMTESTGKEKLVEALNEFFERPSQGETINGTIKAIYTDYMAFMLLCNLDKDTKNEAMKDPGKAIKKYVPDMKIPDDAIIELDPNDRHWPTLVFEKKTDVGQHEYEQLVESAEVVKHIFIENGKVTPAKTVPNQGSTTRISLGMNKGDCKRKIIKLPFLVPDTDLFTEYRFNDQKEEDPEIILTCC